MNKSPEAQRDRAASSARELQSWYEARLRPRLARAARLGLVDEGRLQALHNDLSALIGSDRPPALAPVPKRSTGPRRTLPHSAYDGPAA